MKTQLKQPLLSLDQHLAHRHLLNNTLLDQKFLLFSSLFPSRHYNIIISLYINRKISLNINSRPIFYSPVSANRLIRSPISSRTRWKTAHFSSSVPSAFAGSSNPQCSLLTCGGVIGQRSAASPQRVTAKVALLRYSVSISSDSWLEISIPTSSIALTALGFKPCASIPALLTSHSSPRSFFAQPSAIWLLQELPVHKK